MQLNRLIDPLTQHLFYRVWGTAIKLQIVYLPASKGLGIDLDFIQCGARESHTCVTAHVCVDAQLQSTVMDIPRQFCNASWEPGRKQAHTLLLYKDLKHECKLRRTEFFECYTSSELPLKSDRTQICWMCKVREVDQPGGFGLQPSLFVSLHGHPAVVYDYILIAQLLPAVLRQPVGHVSEQTLAVDRTNRGKEDGVCQPCIKHISILFFWFLMKRDRENRRGAMFEERGKPLCQ